MCASSGTLGGVHSLGVVFARTVIQRQPPDSWWRRAARIADAVGETVDWDEWEAGSLARDCSYLDGENEKKRKKIKETNKLSN